MGADFPYLGVDSFKFGGDSGIIRYSGALPLTTVTGKLRDAGLPNT
jgi:hypothetical protein